LLNGLETKPALIGKIFLSLATEMLNMGIRRNQILLFWLLLSIFQPALTQAPRVGHGSETVNDVSRLNPVMVRQVFQVESVEQIRSVVVWAKKEHLKVSIAGKRHSQGQQTAREGGLVLDMTRFNKVLGLNRQTKVITVQSGATWKEIQNYANPYGLAVEVQQASNIFTLGGSLSVNAHGRDPRYGPIIQSVRAFRLMIADGSILQVSRTENSELFSLAIGGYGMFGVIVDVDLELTDDEVYQREHIAMDYKEYPAYFAKKVKGNPEVGLEYAWPSIRKSDFLRNLGVYRFVRTSKRPAGIYKLHRESEIARNRAVFGLSRHSEEGKSVRWFLQETMADLLSTSVISRNNAMRPPIKFLAYDSAADTDILQEYFVPTGKFVEFMDAMRRILVRRKVDLLSLTVRYVPKDSECFLAYSRQDSFAFVLYINMPLNEGGRQVAQVWTRELVDAATRQGGTYYLPYQLYASQEQIRIAYPMLDDFFSKKRQYDPEQVFDSGFYQRYRRATN
jgi:decaprenylphospho-beta-D-ribofuranose 2-oxidase